MSVCSSQVLPDLDTTSWSLTIDGLVRQRITVHYADLLKMPCSSYTAVLERCGSHGRPFGATGSGVEGLIWPDGAAANLEWAGVPVALLLELAGIRPQALQAECAGPRPFVRGVAVSKLLDDTMLAYNLNGRPLTLAEGGPVRLIVPGWSGTNWVKWISRITLLDSAIAGSSAQKSSMLHTGQGQTRHELPVKSLISSPVAGARLVAGKHMVHGYAWSGGHGIAGVEISADAGRSWEPATLLEDQGPRAWRGFVWPWQAAAGNHTLLARATDLNGASQPVASIQGVQVTVG